MEKVQRSGWAFGVVLGAVVMVMGCSVDSDSSVSDEVDARIAAAEAQAQAGAAQTAAQPAAASSSSSESSASTPSSSASSSGGSLGGFVWKPISEGDGNLVVLLPSAYANRVSGVDVLRGGSLVERGRFTGNTNGNRPTYRYSQPGAGYGSSLTVVARLSDGTTRTWSIPNGGSRVG